MTEPQVCCVMLTRDRPEMAKRAVECFRAQTYRAKCMAILDFGATDAHSVLGDVEESQYVYDTDGFTTIGRERNWAIENMSGSAQILLHFDDDDWSHPSRIAEQVALLQSSGAGCVGYNEMLFWDSRPGRFCGAWLYSNPHPREALGTSLCYWRKTWERNPFPATSQGEDFRWLAKVGNVKAVSSLRGEFGAESAISDGRHPTGRSPLVGQLENSEQAQSPLTSSSAPRMIASIHGGNTSDAYDPAKMQAASEWKRVPEWDEELRERMKL